MKYSIIAFFILSLFTSFTFGVGHAKLSCKSESGRTLFEADLEEYTTLERASLSVDGVKMPFVSKDHCYVIFDSEAKVFTMNIESEAYGNFDTVRYIKLWAIPATFKEESAEGTNFSEMYKFTAKLKAKDPRKGKAFETPLVLVNCTLGYTNP